MPSLPDVQLGSVNTEGLIVLIIVLVLVIGLFYFVLRWITNTQENNREERKGFLAAIEKMSADNKVVLTEKNGQLERVVAKHAETMDKVVAKVETLVVQQAAANQKISDLAERDEYNQALMRQSLDQSSRALLTNTEILKKHAK